MKWLLLAIWDEFKTLILFPKRAQYYPECQAKREPHKNGKKGFRPAWLSDELGAWVCGVLSTLFGLVGACLLNSHPKPVFIAWSLILIAVVCLGGAAYFWLSNHRKNGNSKIPVLVPRWVFVIISLFGFAVFVFALRQEKPELAPKPNDFSVTVQGTLADKQHTDVLMRTNTDVYFWLVADDRIFPIYYLLDIDFVNRRSISMRIVGYSVETRVGKQWVVVPSLDTRSGQVFFAYSNNLAHAKRQNFETNFNDVISGKNIAPGETVSGWLFLSIPKEGFNSSEMRFRITDSSGNESVEPFFPLSSGSPETLLQGGIIHIGEIKDISNFHIQYWEDRFNH